ncbi:peptidoglycan-recognition protein 1-like [Macrosteles quadrilineatus]|uniref:peptidoglycan-recognition protein 1-like n=1 Tax=Macrosteles quadrilineatus TaxID=74068 RepID=UPI0023E1407A|nr:peptidoglycan-recognition protein 1-like [Macrosteles quadrilineatus]
MGKFKLWDGMFKQMFLPEEWGAAIERPCREMDCTELPLTHVKFGYDDIMTRYKTTVTAEALRLCQRDHMGEGYDNIKYNFAVNQEGIIYECRGWFTEPVLPLKYVPLRYKIIDICFIGDFSEKDPPWPMMDSALHIIMKGLRSKFINTNYRLIGLRDPPEGPVSFIDES